MSLAGADGSARSTSTATPGGLCVEGVCLGPEDGDVTCWDLLREGLATEDGEHTTFAGGEAVAVYCDMTAEGGGWALAARFDGAEGSCPDEWAWFEDRVLEGDEGGPPRCVNVGRDCSASSSASAVFPAPQASYQEVRGFVVGYQWASTDAFATGADVETPIDDAYVDGVSITTAPPGRRHLWTYAAALTNEEGGGNSCPCLGGSEPPSYVGAGYWCESANHGTWLGNPDARRWFFEDPLWDGEATGPACARAGAPAWFSVDLDAPLDAPLEVRILMDDCDEDVAIAAMELYVR